MGPRGRWSGGGGERGGRHGGHVSLERFAGGKRWSGGSIKKTKKEKAFVHKKALLKSYHKIMKKEGLSPAASRLQHTQQQHEEEEENDDEAAAEESEEGMDDGDSSDDAEEDKPEQQQQPKKKMKKHQRPDPFMKAKHMAEEKKRQMEEQERIRQKKITSKEKSAKVRKARHTMMTKKTRRGQPIMKNRITNILAKLQNETK